MDDFGQPFKFSKSERVAILILMIAVIALIIVNAQMPRHSEVKQSAFHNLDSLIQLRQIAINQESEQFFAAQAEASIAEIQLKPFPFNPNNMTDEEWRKIGLSDRQIRNINNYIDKGGKFYSKDDFKKLYSISDEEYAVLEPYVSIPTMNENVIARSKMKAVVKGDREDEFVAPVKKEIPVVNINLVDSITLDELPQIGVYMASRIVRYRERLGGFIAKEQLREVKGMDSARYDAILPYIILDSVEVNKIDLNRDDFKTLLRHPYLDYQAVKAIVNYRESRGMIRDWEQLKAMVPKEVALNPNLKVYLKF